MNIFALDYNPIKAAQMICDKHLPKMIVESVQLLSAYARDCGFDVGYKRTHAGHPCSIWIRLSDNNLNWFLNYITELCKEYTYRRGKVHLSEIAFKEIMEKVNWPSYIPNLEIKKPSDKTWLVTLLSEGQIRDLHFDESGAVIKFNHQVDGDKFVDFYPAMPEECKVGKNSVEMYRNYYRTAKKDIVAYNWKPERGEWFNA